VGSKTFYYDIVPNDPGTYNLQDYVQLVFFSLEKNRYDTLRPDVVLSVSGESLRNVAISKSDYGEFYGRMETEANTLMALGGNDSFRYLVSFVLLLLMGGMVFFLLAKKR
jgi:hypothetical protein